MEEYVSRLKDENTDALFDAILSLRSQEECYRFFEDLADLNDGNPFALPRVLNRLLDEDEKNKLIKHFEADGIAPTEKITGAITEIFTNLGAEGKN